MLIISIFTILSTANIQLSGGLVTSAEFAENYTLDLSSYSKGVYFLHLTAKGETYITKLIVQ